MSYTALRRTLFVLNLAILGALVCTIVHNHSEFRHELSLHIEPAMQADDALIDLTSQYALTSAHLVDMLLSEDSRRDNTVDPMPALLEATDNLVRIASIEGPLRPILEPTANLCLEQSQRLHTAHVYLHSDNVGDPARDSRRFLQDEVRSAVLTAMSTATNACGSTSRSITGRITSLRADAKRGTMAALSVVIFLGASLIVANSVLLTYMHRRLRMVSECALRVSEGDTSARLDITTNDEFGEFSHHVNVIADSLEHALDDAREAAAAKSAFLANMSHEIRTPMTAILGYADLLGERDWEFQDDREALEAIRRNGAHLLCVINDILDYSKLEAGKAQINLEPASICAIVAETVSMMRVRAQEKNLSLDVEYGLPLPAEVRTDVYRLKQILLNLISNSIKFCDDGGIRIVLRMAKTDEGPTATKARLQIEVIDTGIGMTPEQVQHVFKPFVQADVSTTRQYGGTGLGLAICQRLAEQLGGTISVSSVPGEGTSFVVTLNEVDVTDTRLITNVREAMEQRYSDESEEAAGVKSRDQDGTTASHEGSILLVEDGPDNQRLISFILRRQGYLVDMAENGLIGKEKAAARWYDGRPYDVILMDMQMPVMNGYQAAAALREAGYDLPIIALTAHVMSGEREKCIEAGCNDYQSKPISKAALLKCIEQWMDRTAAQQ
ncbi:MAG: response regulator [Planctomycetes bacterium]|nr:response regulator [Planctomycetota bacterium]